VGLATAPVEVAVAPGLVAAPGRPVALHNDERVIALATDALHDMCDRPGAPLYATILTDDGFEVDGVPAEEDDRLAGMASSVQALSEAVAGHLSLGGSQFVIMAAEAGHVIQLRVPGQKLVMAAVFGVDDSLATALSTVRLAAGRFAAALAASEPR
jgi:predicted regulator of Ras-like GTPase activity (Roadblock/LC7/MglB family)